MTGHGPESGPFATEGQARATPQVRQVYAKFGPAPGQGNMDAHNIAMIMAACDAAGLELGQYDKRVIRWLGGYEPAMCAAFAAMITRAARPRPRRTS